MLRRHTFTLISILGVCLPMRCAVGQSVQDTDHAAIVLKLREPDKNSAAIKEYIISHPDESYAAVRARWNSIESQEARAAILNLFDAADNPHLLSLLDVATRDPAGIAQDRAFYLVRNYAFRDMRWNEPAYVEWAARNKEKPPEKAIQDNLGPVMSGWTKLQDWMKPGILDQFQYVDFISGSPQANLRAHLEVEYGLAEHGLPSAHDGLGVGAIADVDAIVCTGVIAGLHGHQARAVDGFAAAEAIDQDVGARHEATGLSNERCFQAIADDQTRGVEAVTHHCSRFERHHAGIVDGDIGTRDPRNLHRRTARVRAIDENSIVVAGTVVTGAENDLTAVVDCSVMETGLLAVVCGSDCRILAVFIDENRVVPWAKTLEHDRAVVRNPGDQTATLRPHWGGAVDDGRNGATVTSEDASLVGVGTGRTGTTENGGSGIVQRDVISAGEPVGGVGNVGERAAGQGRDVDVLDVGSGQHRKRNLACIVDGRFKVDLRIRRTGESVGNVGVGNNTVIEACSGHWRHSGTGHCSEGHARNGSGAKCIA